MKLPRKWVKSWKGEVQGPILGALLSLEAWDGSEEDSAETEKSLQWGSEGDDVLEPREDSVSRKE